MSQLAVSTLSREEARSLTDEVKHDAERLWRKLAELKEGHADEVLGYSSWHAYCEAEFGYKQAQAYRLLHAGQAAQIIPRDNGRPNERQARELSPLRADPDALRDAWKEASANGDPSAVTVREAVALRLPPKTQEELDRQLRWATTVNVLDGLAHFDRDPVPEQAEREAALINPDVIAQRGDSLTPARLRRASSWAALLADALERRLG